MSFIKSRKLECIMISNSIINKYIKKIIIQKVNDVDV